jgi:CheY-like chemotaxis protein
MKYILLVDDQEMPRRTLKLFLEHHGYTCKEAQQGAAALAYLEKGEKVDLIVSDQQMPIMTGLELLAQVKANPHLDSIPFILYSGNLTDEIQRQADQLKVTAVLSKPYNLSELVEIVTKAIETP